MVGVTERGYPSPGAVGGVRDLRRCRLVRSSADPRRPGRLPAGAAGSPAGQAAATSAPPADSRSDAP